MRQRLPPTVVLMSGSPPLPLQDSIGFLVPNDSLFIDFIWHLLCTLESHCVSGGRSQRDENASDSILDKALQMISETSAVHTEENNRKVCVELSFCGISGFSRCGAREFSQMAEIRTARYFYGIFLKNSENWLLCGEICSKINRL